MKMIKIFENKTSYNRRKTSSKNKVNNTNLEYPFPTLTTSGNMTHIKITSNDNSEIIKINIQKKNYLQLNNTGKIKINTKKMRNTQFPHTSSPTLRLKNKLKVRKRNCLDNNFSNNITKTKEHFSNIIKNQSFLKDLISLKYNNNNSNNIINSNLNNCPYSKINTSSNLITNSNKINGSHTHSKIKNNNTHNVSKIFSPQIINNRKQKNIFHFKKISESFNRNKNHRHHQKRTKNHNFNNNRSFFEPTITLIVRYETIKFNIILNKRDDNSLLIANKINNCLNLSLNEYQIEKLAEKLTKEMNNIINNIIKSSSLTNYSSIIDIGEIIADRGIKNKEENFKYYQVTIKFGEKSHNFIINDNNEEILNISNNIVNIINKDDKYKEKTLTEEIMNNIRKSMKRSYSKNNIMTGNSEQKSRIKKNPFY